MLPTGIVRGGSKECPITEMFALFSIGIDQDAFLVEYSPKRGNIERFPVTSDNPQVPNPVTLLLGEKEVTGPCSPPKCSYHRLTARS